MFADDTVLKIKGKDIDSTIRQINRDLEKVLNWLNVNKLKLNVDKTKWMIFGYKKNDIQEKFLQIDNIKIERVNTIEYLGITISENLKMEEQVNKIVSKTAKKVNALYRISKKLNLDARKTVYNTIIRPHFDYCSTLYLNTSREQMNSMQAIQNRAMRIVLKCEYLTPREQMLNTLNWLTIEQNIRLNTLIMIYKIKHKQVPKYITDEIKTRRDIHNMNVRNQSDFTLPKYKTINARNSIFYEGLKMFNELPQEIKDAQTIQIFKKECVKIVKHSFPLV